MFDPIVLRHYLSCLVAATDATDMKVVVAGDSTAGKSAILRRFFDNKFEESTAFTIGIDLRHATPQLEDGTTKFVY
ncbi:hypothetical protein OESDEN_12239 [Oesophagostomum dentatum]|uniref:Ras family protein n=1 Tax=Oesophagostomum dentatum TaxID=61180 RepID=A0A0B1SVP9_OESDE|nr:hypothetical protein OESDEN_12239 [Oesophagostomum dentatum]